MNRLYQSFTDEMAKSSKAWLKVHMALTQSDTINRDKLLFEEQRLEKHMQRLMASYQQSLYNSDRIKLKKVSQG